MSSFAPSVKVDISDLMYEALYAELPDIGSLKKGPLHDSPKAMRQALQLREMDPSVVDSKWYDRRLASVPTDQRRFKMHGDELGGNEAWLLRGVLELTLNFARGKDKREDAFREAERYKADAHRVVSTMPDVFQSTDNSWSVMNIVVDHIAIKEQGGVKSWIWTYFIFWEASAYYDPYRRE